MADALIGHTGFVGGNLARQRAFYAFYNSSNIEEISERSFDLVVCAGAPGAKWRANNQPAQDWAAINRLLKALYRVSLELLVLISTVDAATCSDRYGANRSELERMVLRHFEHVKIVRLPALFGAGLKKNALYDLMRGQRLEMIAPNAIYQWYPLRRLGNDLDRVAEGITTFGSEPIAMEEIRARFFPRTEIGRCRESVASYFRSASREFVLSRDEVFSELNHFLSEAEHCPK